MGRREGYAGSVRLEEHPQCVQNALKTFGMGVGWGLSGGFAFPVPRVPPNTETAE